MSQIAVIGAGYVGLTTAACLAHLGHTVTCADVDESKIALLQDGLVTIVEQDLQTMVEDSLQSGRLSFVVGAANAVQDREIVYLCLPTPMGRDGSADLSQVRQVVAGIAHLLPVGCVLVNKSTSPVGTNRQLQQLIDRPDVAVVSNPEFLREGTAVRDFLNPDRIVVGCNERGPAIKVASLYLEISAPVIVTDPASAEMIKYASNAYLASRLSFINSIAAMCEAVGADIQHVASGMGMDHRIGADYLRPGPGWGGSCFPKDTEALLHSARAHGYDFELLEGIIESNQQQFDRIVDKVRVAANRPLDGARIAVWGLTFKAETDDLRNSPSLSVVRRLRDEGAHVTAYDPTVGRSAKPGLPTGIEIAGDAYAACEDAEALVLLTEWDEFREAKPEKVAEAMIGNGLVDGRNVLDPATWRRAGFRYQGVGR